LDLQLYFRVIWRFRLVVAAGLVVASALAFLSLVRVDLSGGSIDLQYRDSEAWQSRATMLVTDADFPLGRSVFDATEAPSSRFTELAGVYAALATTDPVQRLIRRQGPMHGVVDAVALVTHDGTDAPLPMISIGGTSTSPPAAMALAKRAAVALRTYIGAQQTANRIPHDQRVLLTILKQPGPETTVLLNGRSKTVPIVVFLTVLLAFLGLAFVLDNLRPRVRPMPSAGTRTDEHEEPVRRSA
jgi:hypothetical protein